MVYVGEKLGAFLCEYECVGGQGLCVVEAVSYVSLSLAYVSAILLVWCAVKITIIYF